jgi:type I restriction enzyme S subunit
MKRYPKYKDSGVEWIGEIPENWGLPKLKHLISDSFGGEVIDKSFWGEGEETLYTTSKNIHKSDYTGFNNERRTTTDDLLLSRNGDGIVHIPPKGCIYTNVVQLVRIKNKIDRRFLWYSLTFQIKPLNSFSNGDFIVSLNKEQWFNLLTPLPTFEVQHQIVSYLDRKTEGIDKLIQTKERKIELLKEYRTSLISKVVTKGLNPNVKMKDSGVEWIGEIPSHWEVKRLKYFCEMVTEKGLPTEGDINISPENVESNTGVCFNLYSEYSGEGVRFSNGDILLNKLRLYLKKILFTDYEGYSMGEMIVLRVFNGINRFFFLSFFHQGLINQLDNQSTGVKLPRVSPEIIMNTNFPYPPHLEQKQIVSYLDEQTQLIDKTISIEERRIELLKEYRQSLISEVVTGKIKVTNDEEIY